MVAPTRTGKTRAVPLPEFVVRALRAHRRTLPLQLAGEDCFIFSTVDGAPLDGHNLVSRHFKPLLRRAELPDVRLYDLRHSCATLLFAQGVPAKVVHERLRHSDIARTLNTYTHVLPGMQETAAATLNALLDTHRGCA